MSYATLKRRVCRVAAGIAMAFVSITGAQAAPSRVVLPLGTVIPVQLDQALSSKTAQVGDRFSTTVRQGDDDAGMPQGTRIEGVIREAVRATGGEPGVLDVDFLRMVTPGGQVRTLTGSLIALDAKSVERTESGRMVATAAGKGKDRLKFIGIGAGAGLVIGMLTKSNQLTGTLLGAAAGYLYNEFGNKPKPGDVDLKSGTEFGVRMDREFVFQTNDSGVSEADAQIYTTADTQGVVVTGDIGVLINGQYVAFESAKPFLRNGVVFLPLAPVAKAASFDYSYAPSQKMISARNGTLMMRIGSRIAVLNGERQGLNAAPELLNGTVYVPAKFVDLATGGSVQWDASTRTAVLGWRAPAQTQTAAAGSDVGVLINGQNVSFDSAKPFLRNGVTFVPLESVARAANLDYTYTPSEKMIRARYGALTMGIGSRIAVLNGERQDLNAAPEVLNGAVYVPVQFISMATGGSADWDASSRTVVLTGVAGVPGPSDSFNGSRVSGVVNATLSNGTWAFKVSSVQQVTGYTQSYGRDRQTLTPKEAGDTLVVVRCQVRNGTNETRDVSFDTNRAGHTALTDNQQHAYVPVAYDSRNNGYLSTRVLPGSAHDFVVIFSVPKGARLGDLIYTVLSAPADPDAQDSDRGVDFRVSLS